MTEKARLLSNGIPIYSLTNSNNHSFFLSLYLTLGSMHERAEESGITHFFEHVSIRNINRLMGGELYAELDRLGLELGASTYSEMVQIYISGAPESFSRASEILTRVFEPIVLDKWEIDAERERIKAEIREADERSSLAGFTAATVFEGTSLSRPITGTLGGVSRITRARLEKFRRRVFSPDNLFFYVTGCVTDEGIDRLAELTEKYTFVGTSASNTAPVPSNFGKRPREVFIKNGDFCKVRFTFDLDMSGISVPVADLIYDILLSGYSSELFIEMSEKRGIFYDVGGSVERYSNIGTLSFSYELKESRLADALSVTVDILRDLKERVRGDEECMKAGYVMNSYMLLDDPRELNFTMAYDSHILGLGYPSLEDRRRAYASVTPDAIRATAKRIFTPDNLTLTVKGRAKRIDKDTLLSILDRLHF